jgi:hypothetical protein
VVRVDADKPFAQSISPTNHSIRYMWNHTIPSFHSRKCPVIYLDRAHADRELDHSTDPIYGNPGLRLAQYISLDNLQILSVCMQRSYMLSVQVNGDPTQCLGQPPPHSSAVTISHFFHEGEQIRSIHLVTVDKSDIFGHEVGPFLLVSQTHSSKCGHLVLHCHS